MDLFILLTNLHFLHISLASNIFPVSTETVATSPFNGEWPLRGHAPSILTSLAAVVFSSPFLMRMSLAPFCTDHVRTTFRCLFALPSDHCSKLFLVIGQGIFINTVIHSISL